AELERVTHASNTAKKENDRIKVQFQNVRKKFDIGGFGRVHGLLLIEQQRQLPEPGLFEKRAIVRANSISEIGLQQLKYNEQYKQLQNIPDYLNQLIASETVTEQGIKEIKSGLEKLAVSRQKILKRLVTLNSTYLQALSDSEFSDQALLSTVKGYQEFLAQRLLWLRSGPLPNLATLNEIPSQLAEFLSPVHWRGVITVLENQSMHSPTLILGLIIVVLLIWKTKSMRSLLRDTGKNVGRISRDSMIYTFQALVLTLLLAAPWPLLLAIFAWQLSVSEHATTLTSIISYALFRVSLRFFSLRMVRVFCEPNGLAIAHFHMPKATIQKIYRELGWLMIIFLPSVFIFIIMFRFDLAITTGDAGRSVVAVALISLAVFFYRITAPEQNILSHDQVQNTDRSKLGRRCWWQLLLVATPLVLAIFTIIGYIYTASFLAPKFVNMLWFILALVVVKKIVVRWLLLAQRRLALQAALEERAAARAKREAELSGEHGIESESGEVEEPEVDFVTLSQESRHLLNVALVLFGIFGFVMIWVDVFPAFGLLNEITLWHHTVLVSGEQQLIPVTLMDLGRAGMIAFITVTAAKYLPSLLEIIMLQQTAMTAGSRYTVTTMTNYIIVATGMILFFNILGVDWSKLQWLVAALGVGIGFGLQEIVANFISGIIILFERPIRIGDTVTIGDNDGIVVRIRIRATTIRNWDRKELLVPNKEFITGQLINWTLSDPTSRIVIPVGLAYGGDVELALKLMLEAAEEHSDILLDPVPTVIFDEFGDNALSLKLRCFIADTFYRLAIITALHKAINQKFNEAGLVIAFPQRDVHLDTNTPLDIHIRRELT
ncbi:MAG: mechanosensitive ion channel, partial [Methylococcales bacterium]|nr:mechanosensitive ion channel [Methylococcales bacterium]